MADMPVTGGVFTLNLSATASGSQTVLLATENKFVDKNISIKFNVAEAATPALVMNDSTAAVTVSTTANSGVFTLTNSLSGKTTYGTAGWITKNGLAAATDTSVQVGTIPQSTMAIGAVDLANAGEITPSTTANQTVTISAGYEAQRTIIVKSMSAGTPAAATVTASKQATVPTLTNTASAQNNKTQITVSPTTATTGISKYYIAVTANAPATNFAASNFTKTINTAGYLDKPAQITIADNAIKTTANSSLFYLPIDTASATVTLSGTATTPTATSSTAALSGKTRLTGTPSNSATGISTYYIPFTVNAPATNNITANKVINTNGYVDNVDQITVSGSVSASNATYYMPITTGELKANAGTVNADTTDGGVSATVGANVPSGFYIKITGSGQVGVQTAGWVPTSATQNSNTATKYISLNTAEMSQNQTTGTVSVSEGYVPSGGLSLNIERGSINSGTTSKENDGYVNNNTVVPEKGYLYINAGYHPNTQISLATLIPDDAEYSNATSNQMLFGYEAYDTDGNKLVGTITTYLGTYTLS